MTPVAGASGLVVAAVLLAACAAPSPSPSAASSLSAAPLDRASGPVAEEALEGDLVVLAAASLVDTFTELAREFEAAHPQVTVSTGFAGSSGLAQQLLSGAPADVLASASTQSMSLVVDEGLTAAAPTVFARNSLVLAVPAGNPGAVTGLDDLADPGLLVALCEEQVPCGAAAAELLSRAGVVAEADTLEQDVRGVLTLLALGEVDAGLVYRTDVLASDGAVRVVETPAVAPVVTDYLVAPLPGQARPDVSAAFVALVLSPAGQDTLARAGFLAP